MSFISFFLFLLLFVVFGVVLWIYRVIVGVKRRVSDIFGGGNAAADGPAGAYGRRRKPEPQPRRRGKIFDATQGEYVEYEEVACDVDRDGDHGYTERYTATEEQVTDAEWEEIR